MRKLLIFYVFSMFLLSAFSLLPLVSFNFPIAVVATFLCLLRPTPAHYDFANSNMLVAGLLAWGIFAWIFYPIPIELQRSQALLQWMASFLILWLGVRRWIAVSGISFMEISKAAYFGAITLALFVILEFVLANTTGIYLSDIFPFAVDKFPEADVFMAGVARPRGFAAEAGFTSMVFELFIPLSLYYLRDASPRRKTVYGVLCGSSLILLYSTTFFIAGAITVTTLQILRANYRKMAGLILLGIILTYVIAMHSHFFFSASGYKIYEFINNLNYSDAPGSRQEALAASLNLMVHYPFGIGWGTVLQEAHTPGSPIGNMIGGTGLISMWFELAVATGVVSVLIFVTFIWTNLVALAHSSFREAHCCFLALGMLTIHHIGVFELWFPMFWFALGLSQLVLRAERRARAR